MLKNIYVGVWSRLKLEGVAQFSLSPGKAPAVAVFIPEKNVSKNTTRESKRVEDTEGNHFYILGSTCHCTYVQYSQLQHGLIQQDILQGGPYHHVLERSRHQLTCPHHDRR